MVKILERIKCIKTGHHYIFSCHSLGGDWIQCERCHHLEEYIPGVHEPKGYEYEIRH